MDWELVKPISRVSLGKIGAPEAFTIGHGRDVLGLHPGLVRAEYLIGETPQLATTFIRQFLDVRGDFTRILCHWMEPFYQKNMVGQNSRICSNRI